MSMFAIRGNEPISGFEVISFRGRLLGSAIVQVHAGPTVAVPLFVECGSHVGEVVDRIVDFAEKRRHLWSEKYPPLWKVFGAKRSEFWRDTTLRAVNIYRINDSLWKVYPSAPSREAFLGTSVIEAGSQSEAESIALNYLTGRVETDC